MKPLKTCRDCKHLQIKDVMGNNIGICQKTGLAVAQSIEKGQITFFEITQNCPLPDSEVVKCDMTKPLDSSIWQVKILQTSGSLNNEQEKKQCE